jgi:hypothetical protein
MSHRKKRIPVGNGYEVIFDERAQGEESPYWAGRVLHHGKEVGTFRNEGRGGMTRIQPPAIVDAFRRLVDEADPVRGPTCFERESLVLVWAEIVGYVKNYFLDNRPVPLAYIVREFAKDFGQPGTSSPSIPRSEPRPTAADGGRYKIEARTKNGPISWHPYASRAEAEQALPGIKKRAPPGVIRGSWKILPIEPGSAEANPPRTGALTARERLSLHALDHIVKAMRTDRGPAETVPAILEIVINHGIDRGEDVAAHASPAATPRVRVMLSALDGIVKAVHSDRDDDVVEEEIAAILADHGIAAGDVDKVLRAGAPDRRSALSDEEHAALIETKRRIGRRWKAAVRHAWESGNYREIASADEDLPSVLQRLRNASYFGPSGLIKYTTSHAPSDDIRCAECGDYLELEDGEPVHANRALDAYHDAEIPPSKA